MSTKTVLRPMWDQRKQMYKIVKKTFNGSGGWARFGAHWYVTESDAAEAITRIVNTWPEQYQSE